MSVGLCGEGERGCLGEGERNTRKGERAARQNAREGVLVFGFSPKRMMTVLRLVVGVQRE